jgi:hypothetical protein
MTEGASLLRGKRLHSRRARQPRTGDRSGARNEPAATKATTGGMPRTIRQTRTSPATRPRRLQRTSRIGIE